MLLPRQEGLAELLHQFRDLLLSRSQVWRFGGVGHQTVQGVGAQELQAEASLCRHRAKGCPRKIALRPVERLEIMTHMVT